jgi:hypothetical protein
MLFDSSVFFLQNDAARERRPLWDKDRSMLKAEFAMNPVNGRGSCSRKNDNIHGERSSLGQKVEVLLAVS